MLAHEDIRVGIRFCLTRLMPACDGVVHLDRSSKVVARLRNSVLQTDDDHCAVIWQNVVVVVVLDLILESITITLY